MFLPICLASSWSTVRTSQAQSALVLTTCRQGFCNLGRLFFSAQLIPNHSIKMIQDNFITVIASNLCKPLLFDGSVRPKRINCYSSG